MLAPSLLPHPRLSTVGTRSGKIVMQAWRRARVENKRETHHAIEPNLINTTSTHCCRRRCCRRRHCVCLPTRRKQDGSGGIPAKGLEEGSAARALRRSAGACTQQGDWVKGERGSGSSRAAAGPQSPSVVRPPLCGQSLLTASLTASLTTRASCITSVPPHPTACAGRGAWELCVRARARACVHVCVCELERLSFVCVPCMCAWGTCSEKLLGRFLNTLQASGRTLPYIATKVSLSPPWRSAVCRHR